MRRALSAAAQTSRRALHSRADGHVSSIAAASHARPSAAAAVTPVAALRTHRGVGSGHCCGGATASTEQQQRRRCSSSSSSSAAAGQDRPYTPGAAVQERYPIVQLPARSLWCRQYALDPRAVAAGEYAELIANVKEARRYYQYPSMSAPQVGWNVQMFTLFDGTVFINPVNVEEEAWRAEAAQRGVPWPTFEEEKMRELRADGRTGFAWEPCASSGFLLHYIERPLTVRVRALDERGRPFTAALDKMRGRMALHELDHMHGVLFTRRVVDTDHVVPLEGLVNMSDWSDDYPSLEARSTYLYTVFTPPYTFDTDSVPDGNLLDRKFEDGIYPGCEQDRQQRIELTALEEVQRRAWRKEKAKHTATSAPEQQQQQRDGDGGGGGSGDGDADDGGADVLASGAGSHG
ncbi:Peptide deformylase 2 [Novymonas esmeraldas]|uniref:Peptide deformylase n=1 Tax=Novymonas esmeraldas TaxID=1808958 RepID=A0AAW0EWX5_9TRYP